jgi:glycine/D-amino acid oxidase-like deaminating enzyme
MTDLEKSKYDSNGYVNEVDDAKRSSIGRDKVELDAGTVVIGAETHKDGGKLNRLFRQLFANGVEARGVERVLEEDRVPKVRSINFISAVRSTPFLQSLASRALLSAER